MIKNLINNDFHFNDYEMETSYVKLRNNVGLDGDSLSRSQSSYVEFDFVDNSSKFRSSDFDIQSLLEVGAYDMMKPVFVSTLSSMSFADQFQNIEIKAE